MNAIEKITPFAESQSAARVIELTPAYATKLLNGNINNRSVRPRYVKQLAKAIERGEWLLNGDCIRVSSSGRLLDGQHRCLAVITANQSITTFVATGLDDGVFHTIDRGAGRTTGDALHIKGLKNYRDLASVSRLILIYERAGNPFHGNPDDHPTTKQQLDFLESHPEVAESVDFIRHSPWLTKYITVSVAAFCHYQFTKYDPISCNTFFNSVESGAGLDPMDPQMHLRNRVIEDYLNRKNKISKTYKTALCFKAFKLFLDGAKVKTLRVRTEGDAAEKDIFIL